MRPKGWPQPPLRAWEMWQVTPATSGSSKLLTQTLSLGESRLKVVLTQARSSAAAVPIVAKTSIAVIHRSFTFRVPFGDARMRSRCAYMGCESLM